ncbi:polymorphic toxin-type HINT domain-containing protein, partial [Streptomyces sp. MUM 16J]|uniref:polymorphic toxin-type HINT domain-containing protein n=1 Tax=Streptomyces sp. MUM 16J TaxID=2791988 RepID=UPI001F041273
FKVWRALDRAYTAVKDAEEAAKIADDALDAERAYLELEKTESAGTEAASCAVHSFTASTGVRLADGSSKPISHIKTGDTVLATDPQTGVTAPEKVQKVIVTHTDHDFTTLTLDTTPVRGPPHTGKQQRHTLTTTWHHPFWDTTRHRWTDAHNLTPGTQLRRPDGTNVTVTAAHNFHQHKTSYDLTVGTLHTYYVLAGATPVLVHNCNGAKLELTYKPDWSPEQIAAADEKVAALNAAPQLIVTKVQRSGSAADVWRRAGNQTVPGTDIDHKIDLQLGGLDDVSNMWPLDSSVNRSLGSQISAQLKKQGLQPGALVCSISITVRTC